MISKKYSILPLLGTLMAIGCLHTPVANHPENLISAEFHLQQGFEKHWVCVELNGENQFESHVRHPSPIAPLAEFQLEIPSGNHQLVITWVPIDGDEQARRSEVDLNLDTSEVVYLGLSTYGGSITVTTQARPFSYI